MASIRRRIGRVANALAFDVHKAVYRASGGRIGQTIPSVGRTLLLDHVGRKSGKRRTNPLLYIEDGDDLVIVASKGGAPRHPAWWVNLREMPETTVQVGREMRRVVPHEARGRERKRLWSRVVEVWPDYERYQQRTEREIPVVILSPARR